MDYKNTDRESCNTIDRRGKNSYKDNDLQNIDDELQTMRCRLGEQKKRIESIDKSVKEITKKNDDMIVRDILQDMDAHGIPAPAGSKPSTPSRRR